MNTSAGIAGNFFSAAFETPCLLVVGASGSLFGIAGCFLGDIILNFDSIPNPWISIGVLVVCLGLTFGIQFAVPIQLGASAVVSHWSHAGGLFAGICLAFLFLPNLKHNR